MTNVAAAIGVAQLERIDATIARKREVARLYTERLEGIPGVTLQRQAEWAAAVWWMVSVLVDPALRDDLMQFLKDNGVETRPFFFPAHELPMYQRELTYPVAERLGASGVNSAVLPGYHHRRNRHRVRPDRPVHVVRSHKPSGFSVWRGQ